MSLVQVYNQDSVSQYLGNQHLRLHYFHANSSQWIIWCAEDSCERVALIGSLVYIIGDAGGRLFVVPLCKHHAKVNVVLDIGDVIPVPFPF